MARQSSDFGRWRATYGSRVKRGSVAASAGHVLHDAGRKVHRPLDRLADPELDLVRLDGDGGLDLQVPGVVEDQDPLLRAGVLHHDPHEPLEQVAELELAGEGLGGTHGGHEIEPARRVGVARMQVGDGAGRRARAGGAVGVRQQARVALDELARLGPRPPLLVAVEGLLQVGAGDGCPLLAEVVLGRELVAERLVVDEAVLAGQLDGPVV